MNNPIIARAHNVEITILGVHGNTARMVEQTSRIAQVYLRLFELVYRLTPFADDDRPEIRGRCPLELAGCDLHQLPIAEFFMNFKLPPLAL